MAKDKKSFVIYCDLIDAIDHLTTLEKGELFVHLLDYVNDKNPVMENRMLMGTWKHIEQSLKRDLVKYESRADRSRENGKLGGRPKNLDKPSGLNKNPDEPKEPVSVTDTDTVTDTDSVNEKDIKYNILFDLFWSAYDKKVGHKDKLMVKFKTLSESDIGLIMDYIPRYKMSRPEKQYRKDPSTFLNNKGWLDEIILPAVKKVKKFQEHVF